MSVDFYFHQKNQTKALDPEFLKKRLSPEFEITGMTLDEETGLVKFFDVKPKRMDYGVWNKEELSFGWQDLTKNLSGQTISQEELDEIKSSKTTLYRYFNSVSYGAVKPDIRMDTFKFQARIAQLLDMVIDNPQTGLKNVPPNIFASPELQHQAYLKKEFRNKVKWKINKLLHINVWKVLVNFDQSLANDMITSLVFVFVLLSTWIFKFPLSLFISLFFFLMMLRFNRRRALTFVGYLLVASYYLAVFFYKDSISDYKSNVTYIPIAVLIVYGIIHLLFYSLQYRLTKKYRIQVEKDLTGTHFVKEDIRNFELRGYYDYLYQQVITKTGVINFIIFLLLIQSLAYIL